MKKRWVAFVALIVAITAFGAEEQWVLGQYIKDGKVDTGTNREQLNVRSGPGINHEVVGALKFGESVEEYDRENGWIKIDPAPVAVASTPAEGEKWVLGQYVKNGKIDTGSSGTGLNVRSGPGTSFDPVGALEYGENVTVYEERSGWVRITPDAVAVASVPAEGEKWVLGQYVKNGRIDTGSSRTGLNVRSGPGTDFDPVGALEYGEQVTVYEQRSGWVRITPDAVVAKKTPAPAPQAPAPTVPAASGERWILGQYVKNGRIDTGSSRAGLNVRSGPGSSYSAVGALKYGESVTEYASKDGWVRISASSTDQVAQTTTTKMTKKAKREAKAALAATKPAEKATPAPSVMVAETKSSASKAAMVGLPGFALAALALFRKNS